MFHWIFANGLLGCKCSNYLTWFSKSLHPWLNSICLAGVHILSGCPVHLQSSIHHQDWWGSVHQVSIIFVTVTKTQLGLTWACTTEWVMMLTALSDCFSMRSPVVLMTTQQLCSLANWVLNVGATCQHHMHHILIAVIYACGSPYCPVHIQKPNTEAMSALDILSHDPPQCACWTSAPLALLCQYPCSLFYKSTWQQSIIIYQPLCLQLRVAQMYCHAFRCSIALYHFQTCQSVAQHSNTQHSTSQPKKAQHHHLNLSSWAHDTENFHDST